MKAIFGDMATGVDRLDRKAFGCCIVKGAYFALKYASNVEDRAAKKAALAEEVHTATGVELARCLGALEALDLAVFGVQTQPRQSQPQSGSAARLEPTQPGGPFVRVSGPGTAPMAMGQDRRVPAPVGVGAPVAVQVDPHLVTQLRATIKTRLVVAVVLIVLAGGPFGFGILAAPGMGLVLWARAALNRGEIETAQSRLRIATRVLWLIGGLWAWAVCAVVAAYLASMRW